MSAKKELIVEAIGIVRERAAGESRVALVPSSVFALTRAGLTVFRAGAKAEDPTVNVRVNYTGSFSDVALATEAANSFVASGAEVMTGTAQMVVGAVGVAKEKDVAWFGTQSNQTSLAPTVVVASQVYHWEVVLSEIIDSIRGGTFGGKAFTINLANNGELIEYNDAYSLPADVKAKAEEAIKGIKDGSIKTGASG